MSSRRIVLAALAGMAVFAGVAVLPPEKPAGPAASSSPLSWPTSRARYLGARACQPCHEERFREFELTTHHHTSAPARADTIKGSFAPGRNLLATRNRYLVFEMLARSDGFHQIARRPAPPGAPYGSGRIEMVIGSGKLGQSYVHDKPDGLYQTPVSYVTAGDRWTYSPGYEEGGIDFDRPIRPACLECHATHVQTQSYRSNAFHVRDVVLGISCERCHGPGGEHVEHHRANPKSTTGAFIVDPRDMSRRQRLDLCAQCHAKLGPARSSIPFSFRPGRPLDEFYEPAPPPAPGAPEDTSPHAANQLERLEKSKCFQTGRMDCVTCHDPHVVQRGSARFSSHCTSCHKADVCPEVVRAGPPAKAACVDCHMPRRTISEGQKAGGQMLPPMRDHRIARNADQRDRFRRELGLEGAEMEKTPARNGPGSRAR